MSSYRPPIRGAEKAIAPPMSPSPSPAREILDETAIPDFAASSDRLPTPDELVGRTIRQAVITDAFLALELDNGAALLYER